MILPKITGADYKKFKDDTTFRRIYTVLWWATYDYGWDVGVGSHLGVDIATSAGTPILSIGEGTVIKAGKSNGWGNYITIKHTLADQTIIFSNYGHLSLLNVVAWDIVTRGQKIGEVGNTGNSYGNHLHFQIDITDQLHPYYYVTCGSGKNELALVNQGDCRSYLIANTIDPIALLETGNISTMTPTAATIEAIKDKPILIIEKNTIKSREQILNEEAEEYLKSYNVIVDLPINGATTNLGKFYNFNIRAQDFNKNPSSKNLPGTGVKIFVDTKKWSVFPQAITILEQGSRSIQFTPKTTGPIELSFMLGSREIARKTIYVMPKWQAIVTKKIEIRATTRPYLWEEYDMYISPLTEYGSYVGNSPYNERYILEVTKGKAKFCHQLPPKWGTCDPTQVVESLEFGANETPIGYFATRMIAMNGVPVEISVRLKDKKEPLTRNKITVINPLGIDRRNIYYDAIIAGLGKNWWKTKTGYIGQDQTLTTDMVREMMHRILAYQMLRAGNDSSKKQAAKLATELFRRNSGNLPDKNWTRGDFADLLLKALRIGTIKRDAVWTDEKWVYQDTMATLRSKYKFRWQDQFGERYFQVDKNITIGEALYLIWEVVK